MGDVEENIPRGSGLRRRHVTRDQCVAVAAADRPRCRVALAAGVSALPPLEFDVYDHVDCYSHETPADFVA